MVLSAALYPRVYFYMRRLCPPPDLSLKGTGKIPVRGRCCPRIAHKRGNPTRKKIEREITKKRNSSR
jgi:hypothetical protein